ncbi:MAG TPA: S1/P1 nuclease [Pyrinomonadaceae bacterium]
MKTQIRRLFSLAVASILLGCYSLPAYAWGADGHRIVARIAQQNIRPQTRTRIRQILGNGVTLMSVANYADAVRNRYRHTYNNHFVDIPRDLNDYVATRDCVVHPEKGNCILGALETYRSEAVKSDLSMGRRRFALKFIVHLIGDMHQPLHCSDNEDHGGNDVEVTFLGNDSNLHRVWDSGIINAGGLTEQEFADALASDLSAQEINDLKRGTLITWALEAHTLAREYAYDLPSNNRLGNAYYERSMPVVDKQLLRGGMRLARVLDWMFASHTGTNTQNPFAQP